MTAVGTPAGAPYAARLSVDYPDKLDRLTTLLRLVWVLPIVVLLSIIDPGSDGARTGGALVGVLWFADQRLLVCVQRSVVLARCVKPQTKVAVGLCVAGVHAERRTRFRDGAVGVVRTIEEIGQAVVGLGKARQEAGGFGKFIKRPVP